LMIKNGRKKTQLKFFSSFFKSKIAIKSRHNRRSSNWRSLQPSKVNTQHFKRWNLSTVFNFYGQCFPRGSGCEFGSGPTTLVFRICTQFETDPDPSLDQQIFWNAIEISFKRHFHA
jgi:hypothetical protein